MNRVFILTPLIVLLIICIFSLVYLLSGKDPNKPPSALLNKDVPIFESSSLYNAKDIIKTCLLYTSPSPRDVEESRMPSSA